MGFVKGGPKKYRGPKPPPSSISQVTGKLHWKRSGKRKKIPWKKIGREVGKVYWGDA